MSNKKNKPKNMFKEIAIILTTIIATFCIIISTFFFYSASTMKSPEFFGPAFNMFSLSIAFGTLICGVISILIIWIIYGIIHLYRKSYNNSKQPQKINFKVIAIALILISILSTGLILNQKNNSANVNISEFFKDNSSLYSKQDYFIHNDKIYYYLLDLDGTEVIHKFYVMNLDGTNNKLLTENDKLENAVFYFIHDNEAYYYSNSYDENKKINLETGEISDLEIDGLCIPNIFNSSTVLFSNIGNTYTTFKQIDLKENKNVFENSVYQNLRGFPYFLDYDNGDIYYLNTPNKYSNTPRIYKNDLDIYSVTDYYNYKPITFEFMAIKDNYIYFKQTSKISKLDTNTGNIVKNISYEIPESDLTDIKRINSVNNKDNYFYSNNKIYSFNTETDTFKLVLDNIITPPESVYHINNKLFFTDNSIDPIENEDMFSHRINVINTIIIYDELTQNAEQISNIQKACFDEETLYLVIEKENNYSVKTYNIK